MHGFHVIHSAVDVICRAPSSEPMLCRALFKFRFQEIRHSIVSVGLRHKNHHRKEYAERSEDEPNPEAHSTSSHRKTLSGSGSRSGDRTRFTLLDRISTKTSPGRCPVTASSRST